MKKMIQEMKTFALRGNLLDMAVGFTVGAAFTTIAKSMVNDLVMPPLSLLLGKADFANWMVILREGKKAAGPYLTLADAQAAGAVTLNYGLFLNNLLAFFLVTLCMFILIRSFNKIDAKLDAGFGDKKIAPSEPTDKKCPFCRTVIHVKATRCPQCTSMLEDPDGA